jgi:hypothetical protein
MSALAKLRVFVPQFIALAVTTGAGMGIAALAEAGRIITLIPLAVTGGIAAVFSLFGFISKASTLFDHVDGWERLGARCQNCAKLEQDRDQLRLALLAEKNP